MIDALIAGRLHGHAEERTGQGGSTFVTCKVRTAAGNGDSIFCNVIAFNDDARHALLALGDGDSVAMSGALTPKVWTDKQGNAHPALDLVAHTVQTAYHVTRKRKAMQGAGKPGDQVHGAGIDDDLP
ncbi:single-stranded DNA-binding protein [Pseudoduganella namucuonensis]|uniref:Single-stranded DNA-binding protein n=1 Tax=Pseudoduganella namucuonensis TaxID=1035707 RepID=A0A1I7M0L1_9BURK|nr:single-stranded DNA-binding protein [Pseudoduganella namucuonensis]SFV15504.1 Single-stranded DNA-binding protein [Pseudoduganella namucuonensis]